MDGGAQYLFRGEGEAIVECFALIRGAGCGCCTCKHHEKSDDDEPCLTCKAAEKWQWRGVREGS